MKKNGKLNYLYYFISSSFAALFLMLGIIVKFENLFLFFLAFVLGVIAYIFKPHESNGYDSLYEEEDDDDDENIESSNTESIKPSKKPIKQVHVHNFIKEQAITSFIHNTSTFDLEQLLDTKLEEVNNKGSLYVDEAYEKNLLAVIANNAIKSVKLEQKIKNLSETISSELDEIVNEKEKDIAKNDLIENFKTRDDLPLNLRSNIEYFLYEFNKLTLNEIKAITSLIKSLGFSNFITISECFMNKNGEVKKTLEFRKGDYHYNEIISLEKAGLVYRCEHRPFKSLLNDLEITELRKIARKNSIQVNNSRELLIKEISNSKPAFEYTKKNLNTHNFFSLSDEITKQQELLVKTLHFTYYLSTMEEYLKKEFNNYLNSLFDNRNKAA